MSYRPYLSADFEKTRPQIRIYPGYTSATVVWDIPNELSDEEYHVILRDDENEQAYVHHDNTFYIRAGLEPGTFYNIDVYTRNGPNYNLEYSTVFSTMGDAPEQDESKSPEQEPCTCKDNDDCATCEGAPFCRAGNCQVCDPDQRISTDSQCYADGNVCGQEDTGPQCTACNNYEPEIADSLCKRGYGLEYMCNRENGKCMLRPQPSPSPGPSPSPSPTQQGITLQGIFVIVGVIGFILLVIMLLVLYFSGTKTE